MVSGHSRAAGYSAYVTRSVAEAEDAIATHFYEGRLRVVGPDEDFLHSLSVVDLGALTVGEASFGTEVGLSYGELGAYHVAVPLVGRFRYRQGRDDHRCLTPRRAGIFDADADLHVDRWSVDCRCLAVKVDRLAVHRRLEALLGRPLPHRPRFDTSMDVTRGPGRSWADLALWSLLEQDVPHGLLAQPLIRDRIEQTLLDGLLLAAGHTYRAELTEAAAPMRPSAVQRVMDMVRAYPAEPYDAARLAAIGQVSLRTLQEAFRTHVGMSPTAYVSEVRLQRAHAQLRSSAPGATRISEVAHRWGFAHLGRFAQRYRARFGETPSETLRSGPTYATRPSPAIRIAPRDTE
ncbi:helix-turn-helix transcriptional regulator [Streptomyces boncukensis]|uniref:AraC family transcriptional regulator n=1 Tax=Streptomyces boncukensis TaxID=2711219 RepID=A0A6G4X794_9ACTN|nr:AraC family transcriptional regulator [Streptomyces boncukensis]NGO72624.1 AraC family transcriptional regulator [Streptomyces boncukensis]